VCKLISANICSVSSVCTRLVFNLYLCLWQSHGLGSQRLLCVCPFVHLPVIPHNIAKTDAPKITKFDIDMIRHESWKPIYFGIRRSKGQGHMAQKTCVSFFRGNTILTFAIGFPCVTSAWPMLLPVFRVWSFSQSAIVSVGYGIFLLSTPPV